MRIGPELRPQLLGPPQRTYHATSCKVLVGALALSKRSGAVEMLRCRGWIVDVVYAAIVPSSKLAARASDDAAAAKLWPLADIPMPLAVDHATILAAVFRLVRVHLAVRIMT
jgi:hypothetical protein